MILAGSALSRPSRFLNLDTDAMANGIAAIRKTGEDQDSVPLGNHEAYSAQITVDAYD
jgi:hypothetical protein